MTTIHADFNAQTEDGAIRLTTLGSQSDIYKYGVEPGDWVWLDDGELQVGAQVAEDPRYRLVGHPSWETMIDLIEGGGRDSADLMGEIQGLLIPPRVLSRDEEKRVVELWFRFEWAAPRGILEFRPGYPSFRRAIALQTLGEHGLALAEIKAARPVRDSIGDYDYHLLEMIRQATPDLAFDRAVDLVSSGELTAPGFVAAVNIAAIHAQDATGDQFESIARLILEWTEQFERASGRFGLRASLLSLLHFNRGLILFRLGQADEGRRAIELAYAIEPLEATLLEATQLDRYDQNTKELASRVRSKLSAA